MSEETYTLVSIEATGYQYLIRWSDNSFIPLDENNSDYKKYLMWVTEGNTATVKLL